MKNGLYVDDDGTRNWYLNGKLHRTDGPAVEYVQRKKRTLLLGLCWGKNVPDDEYANGEKHWYLNGKRHRVNGPAIEYENGSKVWYSCDLLHREDGPAIEDASGAQRWYIHGKYKGSDFYVYVTEYNTKTSKSIHDQPTYASDDDDDDDYDDDF